jgi:hypothetical protein
VGTILVIAVAYIIKRWKSNHTANKKEEQKLQQENADVVTRLIEKTGGDEFLPVPKIS